MNSSRDDSPINAPIRARKTAPPDQLFVAGLSSTATTPAAAGAAARHQSGGTAVRSERAPDHTLAEPATSRMFPKGFAHTWWTVPSSKYAAEPVRNRISAVHH